MKSTKITLLLVALLSIQALGQNTQVAKPKNLQAKLSIEQGRRYIDLTWDDKQAGDTLAESYYVYRNFPPSQRLLLSGSINRLNVNECKIEVKNTYAAKFMYAVQAVSSYPNNYKSILSDTVSIIIPSTKLPHPSGITSSLQGEKLTINWKYDSILDLEKFILEIGDKTYETSAEDRTYSIDLDDSYEKSFMTKLQAITKTGVESYNVKHIVK